MFGHPYAFGDGTSPVYVVGMLFEESFVKSLPNFAGSNQGGTSFKLYALNFDLPPSAWPQFVRYLDEYDVQVPLDYNKAPGAEDVPASTGPFPSASSSAGKWLNPATGQEWPDSAPAGYRANSDWQPAPGSKLHDLTGGAVIRFRRGYPDFSDYAEITVPIDPMKGDTQRRTDETDDFSRADTRFAQSSGFQAQNLSVEDWIKDSNSYTTNSSTTRPSNVPNAFRKDGSDGPNWVWHHSHDMKHMLLVPSVLNTPTFGGVFHSGGATWAKKARW